MDHKGATKSFEHFLASNTQATETEEKNTRCIYSLENICTNI